MPHKAVSDREYVKEGEPLRRGMPAAEAKTYRIRDKEEGRELVRAALTDLGRTDEVYSYGVAEDLERQVQVLYFDLPRISPLQFNIFLSRGTTRERLVAQIRRAILHRLEVG